MKQDFFDRTHQAATSWLVRGVFIFIIALLFMLPLYELFTGDMSYKIWTMLIVSSLLLIFEYVVIYLTGIWDENRHLMKIPVLCIAWITILIVACGIAVFLDFFIKSILHPYWIPVIVVFLGVIIFFIRDSYRYIKSKRRDKVK